MSTGGECGIVASYKNMTPPNQKYIGMLSQRPLTDLFKWIHTNAFTGILVLAKDEVKKTIIFDKARPVAARSNILDEALGQILTKKNLLTQAQLQKSLQMIEGKEAVHQGEALVSLGLIDHASLTEVLHEQLLTRVYEVFTWPEGKYALLDEFPSQVPRIDVSEGLYEICFRGLIYKYLKEGQEGRPGPDERPAQIGGQEIQINDIKLVGREMGLFRSINGTHSVADIVKQSRLEESLTYAMLCALRDMELIRLGKPVRSESQPSQSKPAAKASSAPKTSGNSLMNEIYNKMKLMPDQTLFEYFELGREASSAEVQKAYFAIAKKFHPDRLPSDLTPDERKDAESYFAKITDAQSVLTNDSSRGEYVASLDLEVAGVEAERATEILESELEFQKGQILVKKGSFAEAIQFFESAIQKYEQEPEYHLYLGWAMYRNGAKRKDVVAERKGKKIIEKAISMNDRMAEGFYFLGFIAKRDGDMNAATKYFKKTISIEQNHEAASSELRVIHMRQEKDAKSGGLKGLFRKKG